LSRAVQARRLADANQLNNYGAARLADATIITGVSRAGVHRDHGFAPQVRIGLHRTAATRVGPTFRGKGLHEAARIAAEARGGELLASWHAAQPCKFALSEPREVSLKGIAEPVPVVTISWK
jgi:class 3 adenylate cyclase